MCYTPHAHTHIRTHEHNIGGSIVSILSYSSSWCTMTSSSVFMFVIFSWIYTYDGGIVLKGAWRVPKSSCCKCTIVLHSLSLVHLKSQANIKTHNRGVNDRNKHTWYAWDSAQAFIMLLPMHLFSFTNHSNYILKHTDCISLNHELMAKTKLIYEYAWPIPIYIHALFPFSMQFLWCIGFFSSTSLIVGNIFSSTQ